MLQKIRQLKKENSGAKAAGFTIIEVMIVLAIAGLIMAIVFLAIPALQRNNRNTQRKTDVGRVYTLINDYVSNNNGTLPVKLDFKTGGTTADLDLTKEKFSILAIDLDIGKSICTTGASASCGAVPSDDHVVYVTNADCGTGKNAPVYNASARSYALWYYIEGATSTQCLST